MFIGVCLKQKMTNNHKQWKTISMTNKVKNILFLSFNDRNAAAYFDSFEV